MNKTGKLILSVVVVAAIVAVAVVAFRSDKADAPSSGSSSNNKDNSSGTKQGQNSDETASVTITYGDNGFSPATSTIASGESVKIVNNSGSVMEFASDPHPTHTLNPELNTGDIEPGQSITITPSNKGSWGFHNHYNPSDKGTLVIE